uniref:Uncharacterized protein n=1 Tax=Entomoneis paludosa TaxID=265537 RepID=A0A7S2YC25_9STRA
MKRFYQCAVRLQAAMKDRCSTSNVASVYIAADNNYAKLRIQSWDSSKSFKAASDIEVLHIGKSRFKEFDNLDLAYQRVWGELKVLIESACIVMSHSKFSYMGSDLSPQQPRCAVMHDDCEDRAVRDAVSSLHLPCTA